MACTVPGVKEVLRGHHDDGDVGVVEGVFPYLLAGLHPASGSRGPSFSVFSTLSPSPPFESYSFSGPSAVINPSMPGHVMGPSRSC